MQNLIKNKREVTCILHSATDTPGTFEEFFISKGYGFKKVIAPSAKTHDFEAAERTDILIVMGGPMGVYEQKEYPFIAQELQILKKRISTDSPTIGICLGAQLLAAAANAKVYLSDKEEFGWFPLRMTKDAPKDPIVGDRGLWQSPVFQWHQDRYDLPKKATNLLYSERCASQAFRLGNKVYGFQFHLELEAKELPDWIAGEPDLKYGVSEGTQSRELIISNGSRYGTDLRKTAEQVLSKFIALIEDDAH